MTRLLLAYDGSAAATTAIDAAAALFGGSEAVIATVQPPVPTFEAAALARIALPDAMIRDGVAHLRTEHEQLGETLVAAGEAAARAAGLRASSSVVEGASPWRALRALAAEDDVDIVVCGTRGDGALQRALVGSTAAGLLHHGHRPLLVVPGAADRPEGPILAGYDASEPARGALRFAATHLRTREVVVAHARRGFWEPTGEDVADTGAAYARALGLAATPRTLDTLRDAAGELLVGARAIDAAAILVGSRGHGAVAAAMLGSVATALVHAAERPVLVVR
ncbi:universal stress protein [Solirubrobacter sp. CPCC 204708]|uniref:Universal stress protein n=1 Tax=Solirubrobacter deserti TaxID=2282478 RepID=A0ABT4RPA9_9ACTN|nr:universal stress protein [Solirubrobacter deserti]MBE2315707.1 universal stress protein [Solirubrobacter deserti]MDA0140404.1 universal stress protein [Solirubrobacter deserti]